MAKTRKTAEKAPAKQTQAEKLAAMETTVASVNPTTNTRRNISADIERTDRFKNIDDGLVPFKSTANYGNGQSSLDIRDAVVLCQKAYYNFSLFRNIIDLMTEFSVSNIYFRGGNKKGRDFFLALFNKINLWDLQDRFFREYFRSGNVFVYRFDAKIQTEDIRKIIQIFGSEQDLKDSALKVEPLVVPVKYIILNPADIRLVGTADFGSGLYLKMLTEYELMKLRHPQTDEDKEVLDNMPADIKTKILDKRQMLVALPLTPDKVNVVFYKRQDYEPFAVPMGYPVLEDINYKAELKKMDMALTRCMQQIVLLVTTGNEPDKHGINPKNLEALRKLFTNQSVGRVLVADYTTKAEFVIPQIADVLDPKKYEVIDNDINIGLNNIFSGGEKFANQSSKVELFVARLKQARESFINNFLMPEIKRISKSLKFKNYPTPYFEDVELKDNTNYAKIYARLMELGILTPEQGFKAIESNTLPDPDSAIEEQKAYKANRDDGLYLPLIGGTQEGAGAGSPGGSTVKSVTPMGTKASEVKFSSSKIKDTMILAQQLEDACNKRVKKHFKLKSLTPEQNETVVALAELIMANEESDKWLEKVEDYFKKPTATNQERVRQVDAIAARHDVDAYLASILLASKI